MAVEEDIERQKLLERMKEIEDRLAELEPRQLFFTKYLKENESLKGRNEFLEDKLREQQLAIQTLTEENKNFRKLAGSIIYVPWWAIPAVAIPIGLAAGLASWLMHP